MKTSKRRKEVGKKGEKDARKKPWKEGRKKGRREGRKDGKKQREENEIVFLVGYLMMMYQLLSCLALMDW